jgi:hypothetical protein
MMALESFVANVEFNLPMIEDALEGSEHPMGKRALENIKRHLEGLGHEDD